MAVFISHSFEAKPEFDNIVDALVLAKVPYWNPSDVKPGSSLRDQLRGAVEQCSLCIFVATHHVKVSSWCGAELGAFWGAGKPIIVYLADPSLTEKDLPPIVQGDVWERRISRVAARAKELVTQSGEAGPSKLGTAQVGSMTIDQLERLILGAVSLAAAQGKTEGQASTPETIGQAAKGAASRLLEGIRSTERAATAPTGWHRRILWVDDRPDNNINERQAFEAMGISFTLARSTQEALTILSKERFAGIISDMGRKEGSKEGYVLLKNVRATDQQTPFFIYAGANAQKNKQEAVDLGAQGSTNSPQELFDLVVQALPEE
jgi:Response regulator containing CheY-like receiver, AAA-type ATPase, and DNA-binding domains